MTDVKNVAFDWNDKVNPGAEFVLLNPGDYDFTVTSFERKKYDGSAKMPACNKAELTLKVSDVEGNEAFIKESLFLLTKQEWKIHQFFTSIGLAKKDEPLNPDWTRVPGASGRATIYVDSFTGRDGDDVKVNRVKKFLEPVTPSYTQGTF